MRYRIRSALITIAVRVLLGSGATLAAALLPAGAQATGFTFLGFHTLSVIGVSAQRADNLPFSLSISGTEPGDLGAYGAFAGEQLSPFTLHFSGTLHNGADAWASSGLAFTLDTPTLVSIMGTATLHETPGQPPPGFDTRVSENIFNTKLIFKESSGDFVIDEHAVLPAGGYGFGYSAHAPNNATDVTYNIFLTIPEPSPIMLTAAGLAGICTSRRRRFS